MLRAISLADTYKYTAKPNPVVGALLLKGDKIISEGAHERFGENHAEINAISLAKTVCHRCPSENECLEYALDSNQDNGVWGGRSEEERRAIRRQRQPRF